MPIWLRRFTFEKIKEFYDSEREEMEKQQGTLNNSNKAEIARPNISSPKQPAPTYTTKAPKK